MARQAAKLNATPSWLTKDDWGEIEAVYIAARQTSLLAGFNCHVDHIVPLRGKDVCGLHVPWNLQVLPRRENIAKSNKLIGEL
jgi:5-methylcytosine-specific restriction endonuclease McrA